MTVPINAELVRALQANAQNDTPETRRAIYTAFAQAALLVPIAKPLHANTTGLQPVTGETSVEFVVRRNTEGHMVMLAFTDEAAVQAWKAADYYYIMPNAVELFQMALEMNVASILVNVAGPVVGGELTREEFQALAAGMSPEGDEKAGTTVITPPPDAPVTFAPLAQPVSAALRAALHAAFASHAEIAAGYLWQMQIGDAAPHLVAGVQFGKAVDDAALKAAMNHLGDQIAPHLSPGEFMDFIIVEGEHALPVMPVGDARIFQRA